MLRVAALLEREGAEYALIDGINVVSLEGLLLMKRHGRLKDQADAEAIRRALAER